MKTLLAETTPPRRARWQTAAAVIIAGSLGAGAMWMVSTRDKTLCRTAASKVDGAWSKADADGLSARSAEPTSGLTQDRATALVLGMSTYADSLAEAYVEACRVAPQNTPRQVCLDGRLEQLRASRDLALEGEAEELEGVLDPLQDARYCRRADEDALYREVSDPQRAQAVLRRLAQARAWVDAGRQDAAATELAGVVQEAGALGWIGVESLARTELAAAAATAGDTAEADREFATALELASAAGSDVATSTALTRRLQAYSLNGDARVVVALAPAVRAAARRAGNSGASVSVALGNVHQLTGDYESAEVAYAEAITLAESAVLRLRAQSNLGALELYRGKFRLARTRFETLVVALESRKGATSVARLKALANLADAEHQLGEEVPAMAHYAEALQQYEDVGAAATRPAEHLKLNYAIALLESGDTRRAEEIGVPAAERVLQLHGEKHVFSIAARDFMNALARARGQHVEAMASTLRLIEDLEVLFGEGNAVAGFLCLTAAESARELKRTEVGLELLSQGQPLFEGLNPTHPFLVPVFRLRAELHLQASDPDSSVRAATEAVSRAADPSVHPVERGRAHLALAKARMARGDSLAEVRPDLEEAAERFAQHPQHQSARADAVAALLAR